MDSTVIAAIIGGAFAVTGPIATVLVTRYLDNRDKQVIHSGRRSLITGRWSGTTSQDVGLYSSVLLSIALTVEAKRKTMKGEFRVQFPESGKTPAHEEEFTFQGGFLYGNFLELTYRSKDKRRIQFGSAILELDPSGETLSGKYTGYGAFSKEIVNGIFKVKRVM